MKARGSDMTCAGSVAAFAMLMCALVLELHAAAQNTFGEATRPPQQQQQQPQPQPQPPTQQQPQSAPPPQSRQPAAPPVQQGPSSGGASMR